MVVRLSLISTVALTLLACFGGKTAAFFPECPVSLDDSSLDVGSIEDPVLRHAYGDSSGTAAADNAPSPAPSTARACESSISNARGRYTSTLAPCVFRFHSTSQQEKDFIEYHTSSLCNIDDTVRSSDDELVIEEYVKNWPDECVGDFSRCYSLKHHSSVVLKFLCEKGWQLPDGTTHISVDCTLDKDLVLESSRQEKLDMVRQEEISLRDTYLKKFANLVIILGSCMAGIFAISELLVKPFQKRMDAQRCSCNGRPCNCGISSSPLVLPVCNNADDNRSQVADASTRTLSTTMTAEEEEQQFACQIPADFDAIPIVPEEEEPHNAPQNLVDANVTLPVVVSELQAVQHVARTIHSDFETIPMVPATALPPEGYQIDTSIPPLEGQLVEGVVEGVVDD